MNPSTQSPGEGELIAQLDGLNHRIVSDVAKSHPSLTRGQVWCRTCGNTQRVDSGAAMRSGWPKHCGYTMTIDSPAEQARLSRHAPKEGG